MGLPPVVLERLQRVKGMDFDKLREVLANNPHLQERFTQGRDVRNQVDEARRITVEQMRQLQK